MQHPVTLVALVAGSFVTLTNSVKPYFTGSPIFNFFPLVGTSQPLGTEIESPGHIIVANSALEDAFVTDFNFLTIPFSGVQNPIPFGPAPFKLIISKADGCN